MMEKCIYDMANSSSIQASKTALKIIEVISELDNPTLSEIAEQVDLSNSTIHKHLTSLLETEYVVREDKKYRLGLQFLSLGIKSKHQYDIVDLAEKSLEQLADETGETAWLIVEEYGWAVNLDKMKGKQAVQTLSDIGGRIPMHQSAGGKCILAHLPENEVNEIINKHGLPGRTKQTITSRSNLKAELREIRERGYGIDDKEVVPNVRAISSPVLYDGYPLCAITVSGPAYRFIDDRFEEELPNRLRGVTNELELRLEFENDTRG